MIRDAISAVLGMRLTSSARRDFGQSCPPKSENICAPATPASPRPRPDGDLLRERDKLQARLDAAKPRSEARNLIWADLHRVKLECLRRGL